jgi:hypothetical protein
MADEDRIVLKSYSGIWKVDKKIEHLNGISTPSIAFEQVLYFLGVCLLEFILCTFIPPLRKLNIFVFIVIPIVASSLLNKIKLEGKKPIKYIFGILEYISEAKVYVRFRPYKEDRSAIFDSKIGYRRDYTKDKGSE